MVETYFRTVYREVSLFWRAVDKKERCYFFLFVSFRRAGRGQCWATAGSESFKYSSFCWVGMEERVVSYDDVKGQIEIEN